MWIDLLIKENGIGKISGNCSSKLLKFIDFFNIRGGVPVLSLPIENFNFSIFFARATDGLSPTLPAGEDFHCRRFLFLFFLSPILYSYVSLSQIDKRTDYPGKEIAMKIQYVWDQDFDKEIQFVTGDEWKAGNLSYHLKSRPKWEGFNNKEILNNSSQFICVGDVCLGRY